MGPVRMLMDINNRVNVVGDGINVAQRIMDFSAQNQITVSRAYYDVVSRISDGGEAMFEFLGPRLDKHQRSHDIYGLVDPNAVRKAVQPAEADFGQTRLLSQMDAIAPGDIQLIEAELTQAIGPLAHVLVKKTVPRAGNAQDLRSLLSVSIQDHATREAFLHPRSNSSRLANATTFAPSASRSTASGPISRSLPVPVPASSVQRDDSTPTTIPSSASLKVHTFSAEQQLQLERALSQHIGPLAKTLVRKEAARQGTWSSLLQALSQHIDEPADRSQFLAAAGKIKH
jgi:hypothetical protein